MSANIPLAVAPAPEAAVLEAPTFAAAYQRVMAESLDDPERFRSLADDFLRYQVHLLEAVR